MRFTRYGRSERFEWTGRKLAIAKSRGGRQQTKDAQHYPLFAGELQPPPAFDATAEAQRRDDMTTKSEAAMRAFHAGVWRESRRDARAASTCEQDAIRAAWQTWTGPTTSTYYRYIVDLHTGVMGQRDKTMKAQATAIRSEFTRARNAQQQLELEAA
jgi:hypothetical protein